MNRIAELRKKSKISQSALGKVVGAAQNTVCNWENGNRDPDYHTVLKLAEYFGVSVGYLLGQEEMQNSSQQRIITDDDLKFALFGDANVSDEVFEEVRRFAKFAKEQRENKND